MTAHFTEQDKRDLEDIFRIYDFSKVDKVDETVALAEKAGQTPAELFEELYQLLKVKKLPQREAVERRLRTAVPSATDADIESVIRQSEMRGLTEMDAVRSLERKYGVHHLNRRLLVASPNSPSNPESNVTEEQIEAARANRPMGYIKVNEANMTSIALPEDSDAMLQRTPASSLLFARPSSQMGVAPTREALDEIMGEEVREWLLKIVGDMYKPSLLSVTNFIDALRSGVLLHVLLQKMEDPPVADEDLKLPKRTSGFFVRDNVDIFLKEAKLRYKLVDAQLFTVSDLVDKKSDRQVVTCLMAMARIAYSTGTIKTAPRTIVYEHQIGQQQNNIAQSELNFLTPEPAVEGDIAVFETLPDASVGQPPGTATSASAVESPVAQFEEEKHHLNEPRTHESPCVSAKALSEENITAFEVVPDGPVNTPALDTNAIGVRDDVSDRRDQEKIAATSPLRDSSVRPASAPCAGESPTGVCEVPASVPHCAAVAQASEGAKKGKAAPGTEAPNVAQSRRHGSGVEGGGRRLHRRDSAITPKPTAVKEKDPAQQRKTSGPRIVWKYPSRCLPPTKPPY
ncbi:hypothetical protein JKF63_00769 [Porcisia hertigi]|uniref:Calponin-homology (CH) domain-containing protein n=1 Tax=Porcisia hertigi TaxID=2761500 RepID=A0A836GYW7_9TRYP|nr:hypothetical protein JKF63_00769 [Porcisia hertigi]